MQTLSPVSKSRTLTVRSLALAAMFCALYVVLQSVTINLSATLRISFSFLALAAASMCLPVSLCIVLSFAADLAGYFVSPNGAYMPFFALILMVKILIYYFFLHRQKLSGLGIIAAQLCAVILCNILLNPLILSVMYESPFWVLLTSRIVKNAIMFPLECIALYFVCLFVQKVILKRQEKIPFLPAKTAGK